MKQYECLVPGCPWHTSADSEAEIVRRASEHLREVHGEQIVRPEMIERIKQRIHARAAAEYLVSELQQSVAIEGKSALDP